MSGADPASFIAIILARFGDSDLAIAVDGVAKRVDRASQPGVATRERPVAVIRFWPIAVSHAHARQQLQATRAAGRV